jgi:hypothetical protein
MGGDEVKRSTVEISLAVLAIATLVLFWPRIISLSREKRQTAAADEISGVSLTFDNVTASLTKATHEVMILGSTTSSQHPVHTVELSLYQEFDGVPGRGGKGEGLFSSSTFSGPSEQFYRGSPGHDQGWLDATVARKGLDDLKIVLGPPPKMAPAQADFQTLAFLANQGLTVQWRPTSTDWMFRVHREATAGDTTTLNGSLSTPGYSATVSGSGPEFELNVPLSNCPRSLDGASVQINVRRSPNLLNVEIDVR